MWNLRLDDAFVLWPHSATGHIREPFSRCLTSVVSLSSHRSPTSYVPIIESVSTLLHIYFTETCTLISYCIPVGTVRVSYQIRNQTIRHSGVGRHHRNGVDENEIGNVMRVARWILIHDSLWWPKVFKKSLWPLEVDHAVYLHNNIPKMDPELDPIEICSKSKSS